MIGDERKEVKEREGKRNECVGRKEEIGDKQKKKKKLRGINIRMKEEIEKKIEESKLKEYRK